MEHFDTLHIKMMSDEYEMSNNVLAIEVRYFNQGLDLYAEPVSYKLTNGEGKVLLSGSNNPNERGSMWAFVEHVVDGEITQDHLSDLGQFHPAFEQWRYNVGLERDLDDSYYRRIVGY